MNKISISLPESLNAFVQGEVASGRYDSPSQYLEHLVREARKSKAHRSVDRLLIDGINSGEATVMTRDDWDEIRRKVKERSARRNGQ
jgi:antitoxin ParD1/3/4